MKVHDEVVVDVTRPMIFTVTDDDVKTGKRLKSRECPGNFGVLREARKVCPTLVQAGVRVHISRAYIRLPAKIAKKEFGAIDVPSKAKFVWARFVTSAALRAEVISMDKHGIFHSGKFRLAPAHNQVSTVASRKAAAIARRKRTEKIARGFKPHRQIVIDHRKFGANR